MQFSMEPPCSLSPSIDRLHSMYLAESDRSCTHKIKVSMIFKQWYCHITYRFEVVASVISILIFCQTSSKSSPLQYREYMDWYLVNIMQFMWERNTVLSYQNCIILQDILRRFNGRHYYLLGWGAVNANIDERWWYTPARNFSPVFDIPWKLSLLNPIKTFWSFSHKLRCTWEPDPISFKSGLASVEAQGSDTRYVSFKIVSTLYCQANLLTYVASWTKQCKQKSIL